MVLPQLIMAGASLASGIMDMKAKKKAAKKAKSAQKQAMSLIEQQRAMLQRGYADQLKGIMGAESAVNKGTQAAKQAYATQGTAALGDIKQQSAQTLGDIKQHLQNTGTYSSSVFQNAQRGVSAQTTRQIQAVREMVAGLAGGLETQRAGQLADLQMQRGNAAMAYQQGQGNINQQLADIWGSTQYQASSGAAGWGELLGQLAPMLGGIGSGGKGGKGVGSMGTQFMGSQLAQKTTPFMANIGLKALMGGF